MEGEGLSQACKEKSEMQEGMGMCDSMGMCDNMDMCDNMACAETTPGVARGLVGSAPDPTQVPTWLTHISGLHLGGWARLTWILGCSSLKELIEFSLKQRPRGHWTGLGPQTFPSADS